MSQNKNRAKVKPVEPPVRRCIVMGCTNRTDEGTFIGDLCAPCHRFVSSGEGIHSQVYRNARMISPRKVILDLEFIIEGDENRELDCLFCKMKGCDRLIRLWGWGQGNWKIGAHDACIDRHEIDPYSHHHAIQEVSHETED